MFGVTIGSSLIKCPTTVTELPRGSKKLMYVSYWEISMSPLSKGFSCSCVADYGDADTDIVKKMKEARPE